MPTGILLFISAAVIWHALLLHIDRWSLLDRQRRARTAELDRLAASYAQDLAHNRLRLTKRYCTLLILCLVILFLEC